SRRRRRTLRAKDAKANGYAGGTICRIGQAGKSHQSKPSKALRGMNAERLVGLIAGGFHALFEWDAQLFDLGTDGVNEQTITFRLGIYFHTLFEGYHVDCEYNCIWDEPKACIRAGKQSMKPDIIIHRRNSDRANLFCLEAKKE